MITSVLDHHDDNHPVEKNAEALSTQNPTKDHTKDQDQDQDQDQDRKFVFTIFFVLSVFSVICSDCS